MRSCSFAFLVLFFASIPRPGLAQKPNVLFISIDDLNDYISPLDHHPGVKTPSFERLAKRSVTFANAHCAAPACHPSRVAVMTGVHPATSGIYRNLFGAHGPRWRHESPVLADAVVLSQHFRDHGYRAVGGGKIFHTLQWTPGDSQNDPDAWDDYRGDPLDPISPDWPRPQRVADSEAGLTAGRPLGGRQHFGAKPLEQTDEQTGDHMVVDWAIAEMNKPRDKPLFLAVGLFRPHIPFEVPQKWFDLHPIEKVELPEYRIDDLDDTYPHSRVKWHKWVVENKQWEHFMQGYLASISYVDHQLGRLLDGFDASPMKEDTIVVLWTDHGFHIGEKDNWEKFALWDQTTHVPLFIHAPGISKDGVKTQQPATLTDLYPTLCELAGLPIPAQCDGLSLVPQLKEPSTPRKRPALTSFRFGQVMASSHAVADTRYRLIRHGNGFEELYDLQTDPNEFTNRAEDASLAAIKARLAKWLPADPAPSRSIPRDSPYNLKSRARNNRQSRSRNSIAGKPLRIAFEVKPKLGSPDGVLVAHGGEFRGYSVFIQEARLHFAIRRDKELTLIAAKTPAPEAPFSVMAKLGKDGRMQLLVGGKEVAAGDAGGLISEQPNEDAAIGSDPRSSVGPYEPPFTYAGGVERVRVTHSEK